VQGVLAPGTSPGTLTLGGLILNAGSTLAYERGQPDVAVSLAICAFVAAILPARRAASISPTQTPRAA
jgi:hypothetical protein